MNPCIIRCLKPGMLSTIQDLGRLGYQKFGVARSGAMDRRAAQVANYLVGNDVGTPVLEITFAGPSLQFEGDAQIAICGADISPLIGDTPLANNKTHLMADGSVLSFGKLNRGCRAYLAVGGDWKVRKWLGSASAPIRDADQTTPDSILARGSFIKIQPRPFILSRKIDIPVSQSSSWKLSVLPGPEFGQIDRSVIALFFGATHVISPQSNRMGYRMKGRITGYRPTKELISSGCLPGTIQITNEGQIITLMSDAQTTGGYPRIAQLIASDIDALAQAKPGDHVQFQLIDLNQAAEIKQAYISNYPFLKL